MADVLVQDYLRDDGKIILIYPGFDFDQFIVIAEKLVNVLSAQVIEKQCDADLLSWLIRYNGHSFLLRAEHYTGSLWIESLSVRHSVSVMDEMVRQIDYGSFLNISAE
ncbi:DUF3630 family protein [Vibrio salinus]|uniref:DUF3630 family protein n=1 Tax=Vibrio salinus TaxID=2899784 RepID=UPI001E3B88BE|nr:DUF3630 family protein [Vibrio salinus]MCE0493719.1 DUF3630 family protein [Vibrio salinus]